MLALEQRGRLDEVHEQLGLFESGLTLSVGEVALNDLDMDGVRAVLLDGALVPFVQRSRPAWLGETKLAILSEDSSLAQRLRAVELGAETFIPLPIDAAALFERLGHVLDRGEPEQPRVFCLCPEPSVLAEMRETLDAAGVDARYFFGAAQMFEALGSEHPELIIVDQLIDGGMGVEVIRALRLDSSFLGIPILHLSDKRDLHGFFGLLGGLSDNYLPYHLLDSSLLPNLMGRVERFRALRASMAFDGLTHLYNHTHFKEQLSAHLAQSARSRSPLTLAMLDIDHFKQVNDTWGHLVGDRVLRTLAQLLKARLRRSDIIGRYGGDEFAVLLPDTDLDSAFAVLDEVRSRFAQFEHQIGEVEFRATFSCGLAMTPDFRNEHELTHAADQALYLAKRRGKNKIEVRHRSAL